MTTKREVREEFLERMKRVYEQQLVIADRAMQLGQTEPSSGVLVLATQTASVIYNTQMAGFKKRKPSAGATHEARLGDFEELDDRGPLREIDGDDDDEA